MRTFCNVGFDTDTTLDMDNFGTDIAAWFVAQPTVGEPAWLLAYAEDGVIWGKLVDGKLLLPAAETPALSSLTLLEARLFGAAGEIHVWRSDGRFKACRVTEKREENGAFDEWQRLWGTDYDGQSNAGEGFTLLVDGREGLRHTVPVVVSNELFVHEGPRYHPVFIRTRHYFGYDKKTGAATVVLSRLVGLDTESKSEHERRIKKENNR